jgi:hypothetical protein
MRIWYVVDTHEYWLEPSYAVLKDKRVRIDGARLYNSAGQFKGYWHYKDWPLVVKRDIRTVVQQHVKREQAHERMERVRQRTKIANRK